MTSTEIKHELVDMLATLPEAKLMVVYDFVQFLAERGAQTEWMTSQQSSAAYREWVSAENDIYDQVFADVNPTR